LIRQPKKLLARHLLDSVEHQVSCHDFDEKEWLTSNNIGMVVGVHVEKRTTRVRSDDVVITSKEEHLLPS